MALETALATDFAILVLTATLLGFLARKTNQPTIIAYIATGLLLGPAILSVLSQTELTRLLSELGLVFLLFFIGLEIDLEEIQEILGPVALISIIQQAVTAFTGFLLAYLLGFGFIEASFIGAAVMFSSTALVVKLLSDKDEASTLPGRIDIGVLLVQDVTVVLLLALLATGAGNPYSLATEFAVIIGMITAISLIAILGARKILPLVFESFETNPHSLFIYGIAWAFIFITASIKMDISAEIGAFAAGLGLAQLPYDRELQERVRPLTDLFMAMFFINFGLNIAAGTLSDVLFKAVAASAVLMVAKFLIYFLLIDWQKFTPETSFIGSINMIQISEFGLILGGIALSQGFIGGEVVAFLSLVAIFTMGTSSYLIRYNHQIHNRFHSFLEGFEDGSKKDVEMKHLENHAVVVGYDTAFQETVEHLEEEYSQVLVVDRDSNKIEALSGMEVEYLYGDFFHGEIRNNAGLKRAKIVLSGAEDLELNKIIAEEVGENTTLFLKSSDFDSAAELYDRGAHYVMVDRYLAAEQVANYVNLYHENPEVFREEIKSDLEKLRWGGFNG